MPSARQAPTVFSRLRLETAAQAPDTRVPRCPAVARRSLALLLTAPLALAALAAAQSATPFTPQPALPSTAALVDPSVKEIDVVVANLKISKWKAPGPVKDEALGYLNSITRDVETTLPALVSQAEGAPRSVANAFAVYRNLDALYEVLLRVSATADLAASDGEASSLTHALATLDSARRSLADSILTASQAQESALSQRPAAVAPPAAPPPPPPTTVVNDGPAAPAARRKTKPKPPTPPAKAPQT